jgi:hypothetical protein
VLAPTIFHEPWWLDIASGGKYCEAVVKQDGRLVGTLPYVTQRDRFGQLIVGMPPHVHLLGPVLDPRLGTDTLAQTLKQLPVLGQLIEQLPSASRTSFRLHDGITNTLAFKIAGFESTTDYTIEIAPAPVDVLWRQLRDKTRNVIRRAQEQLTISATVSPASFVEFYTENLHLRGERDDYARLSTLKLMKTAKLNGAGNALAATDTTGRMQAAIFTVWDKRREYYFMSTRTPDSMNGAVSMLIWSAIQQASAAMRTFDMDVLHVDENKTPNLLLLTGFGGKLVPRHRVYKLSRAWQSAKLLRSVLNRNRATGRGNGN